MSRTHIAVIGRVELQSLLPIGLRADAKVDAALLPPEQFWGQGDEAFVRERAAGEADVLVDAENLVEHDHGGGFIRGWFGKVGSEFAALGLDVDRLVHGVPRSISRDDMEMHVPP
jgi:hypothetical protein